MFVYSNSSSFLFSMLSSVCASMRATASASNRRTSAFLLPRMFATAATDGGGGGGSNSGRSKFDNRNMPHRVSFCKDVRRFSIGCNVLCGTVRRRVSHRNAPLFTRFRCFRISRLLLLPLAALLSQKSPGTTTHCTLPYTLYSALPWLGFKPLFGCRSFER